MLCRRFIVLMLLVTVLVASCLDTERTGEEWKGSIYTSYSVWGEEDKELVTAFFQFHPGNPDRKAIGLKEPARIFLDGVLLQADSARESGVFYELQLPLPDFTGKHTIRYIDTDNKEHEEEFFFQPFRLLNVIGDTLKRKDLILRFEGLQDKDNIRVVMTDTTFGGDGINEIVIVQNNLLDLSKLLPAIANGPIILNLFKEEERLLDNIGAMGEISITYSLKREFELKD